MNLPTIFLSSRTEGENELLRRKLEGLYEVYGHVVFHNLFPRALHMVANEPISVVVLNFQEWNKRELTLIRDLRDTGYSGPVLALARELPRQMVRKLHLEGVVVLERPYEPKDFYGIVLKMLNARVVAQQVHRRFNTDQNAELECAGEYDRLDSRLCNISKGGAYLEMKPFAPVKVGDVVRIRIPLDEVQRVYTMPAKVVWSRRLTETNNTGIGVEFVGRGNVERNILGE